MMSQHCVGKLSKKVSYLKRNILFNIDYIKIVLIIFSVYGEERIVRGCGYITDARDNKECLKRSGTHDVHALYCACSTDLCNASHRSFNQHSTLYAIMLLPLVYLIQRQL